MQIPELTLNKMQASSRPGEADANAPDEITWRDIVLVEPTPPKAASSPEIFPKLRTRWQFTILAILSLTTISSLALAASRPYWPKIREAFQPLVADKSTGPRRPGVAGRPYIPLISPGRSNACSGGWECGRG